MKILIAPDKFKGSLSARQVCEAIGEALQEKDAGIELLYHPMADGGDGSLSSLSDHLALKEEWVNTQDPLGRPIKASYYTSRDLAFIEVASASGLVLLDEQERNPMFASTIGTGIMVADAIAKGYQDIYLFLGGSATNDGGMGIASKLGFRFLGQNKEALAPIGENLSHVAFIEDTGLLDFDQVKITLFCDVTNPFYGENGAAYVYAPQKGATQEQVQRLDQGLKHFSAILSEKREIDISELPGSGAAGGIGGGLTALCGAQLVKGFDAIAKLTDLETQIQDADWVITGEGNLDNQSLQGKVVDGIARLCEKYEKPLSLFVGNNNLSSADLKKINVQAVFSIMDLADDLEDAMQHGASYLGQLSAQYYTFMDV